jgi:hypothetical protein
MIQVILFGVDEFGSQWSSQSLLQGNCTCGMSVFVDNHYSRCLLLESQTIGKPCEALIGQLAGCRLAGPEKGRLCRS